MIKDNEIKIEWYSGSGSGGQHRNKHQNCCRITHIPTGLRAVGTSGKSRVSNKREARQSLFRKLVALTHQDKERRSDNSIVRTYRLDENKVINHASGNTMNAVSVMSGDLPIEDNILGDRELPKTGRM